MAKKSKALLAAAVAFAASPQGRKLLTQAKEYASRPETKQRAQELVAKARTRLKGSSATRTSAASKTAPSTTAGPAAAQSRWEERPDAGSAN